MPSPEHIFNRPRELNVNTPPEKTDSLQSDLTELQNQQPIALSEHPFSEAKLPSSLQENSITDIRKARHALWEQTGYLAPLAGGSPRRIDLPNEKIIQLFTESGLSTEEIAKQFGVTSETIRNRLHEAGIELEWGGYRWSGEGKEGIGRPTTEISFETLDALYVHQKKTAEEIAAIYNCHPETIRRKLQEARISMKPGPRRH